MNWGFKIILSLAAFILFILGSCFYMIMRNTDTLEDADYYEKGLNYDSTFDKEQNVINKKAQPTIVVENGLLKITFQSAPNKGKLIFKKASDGTLDKTIDFNIPSNQYELPISSLAKGSWTLHVDWESGKESYLVSKNLYF